MVEGGVCRTSGRSRCRKPSSPALPELQHPMAGRTPARTSGNRARTPARRTRSPPCASSSTTTSPRSGVIPGPDPQLPRIAPAGTSAPTRDRASQGSGGRRHAARPPSCAACRSAKRPGLSAAAAAAVARSPANTHAPEIRPLLEVIPGEEAVVIRLELAVQRRRLVITDQLQRSALPQGVEGREDQVVTLVRRDRADVDRRGDRFAGRCGRHCSRADDFSHGCGCSGSGVEDVCVV